MADYTANPTGNPPTSVLTIDGVTDNINPGDTITFNAGNYGNVVRLQNINGTANNRIRIINAGGQAVFNENVSLATEMINCSYIDWLGTGGGGTYGFLLRNRHHIRENCSNIYLYRIDMLANGDSHPIAFFMDQLASLTTPITDIIYDECRADGVTGEGWYLGNTRGGSPANNENLIYRVEIRNCIAQNCSDGFQISSCPDGAVITGCTGRDLTPGTASAYTGGIILNVGVGNATVTNNRIINCDGNGILLNAGTDLSGNSDPKAILVEGNIIDTFGFETTVDREEGIVKFSNVVAFTTIRNNTVIRGGNATVPEGDGIEVVDDALVEANIVVDIEQTGITTGGTNVSTANNLSQTAGESVDGVAHTLASIQFVDYANENYYLQSTSPALNVNNGSLTAAAGYAGALGAEPVAPSTIIRNAVPINVFVKI